MKHVAVDCETTGLSPSDGDRVIQIAAVELVNLKFTGRTFLSYVNPEGREIKYGSYQVHKISTDRLVDAPLYGQVHPALMEFIGDGQLVIQNKGFDLGFLRSEAARFGLQFPYDAIDTIDIARQKWPGAQVGLDALCKRLQIPKDAKSLTEFCRSISIDRDVQIKDRSEEHNALVDCLLLGQVYIAMMSETEFDLSRSSAGIKKPWPFAQQRLDIAPLNFG